jgi:hypothetical protein
MSNKKNTKNIKIAIFPIFLECKLYTLDPFWHNILDNCAYGNFPKGVKIEKNGELSINSDEKVDNININNMKDPLQVYKLMMDMFKNKLHIKSSRDSPFSDDIKRKVQDGYNGTWKQIKPKKLKDKLITEFVLREKEKHNLTSKQAYDLLNVIKSGFLSKSIISEDIDYSNRKINEINGLIYNSKNKSYKIENNRSIKDYKLEKNSVPNRFSQYLERYLKDYQAQIMNM